MRSSTLLKFPSGVAATLTVTGGQPEGIAATILVVRAGGTDEAWSTAFTANYVAQLVGTSTISFSEFLAGIRAAATAAAADSGSANLSDGTSWQLDLLTMAQLLQLRAAKTGDAASSESIGDAKDRLQQRRFLIVTRTQGADRVHFPLPLDLVVAPNRGTKPNTAEHRATERDRGSVGNGSRLRRLRARVLQLRQENKRLVDENYRLTACVEEAASLQREASELGTVARRARASLDQRRRRQCAVSAELSELRAQVEALRSEERETRRRLTEAESALAAQRAGLRVRSMRRRALSLERSNPTSPRTLPTQLPLPLPKRQPRSSTRPASSTNRFSNGPLSPMPYQEDIADIDKRLEQLRCALDQALLLPAHS